MSIVCVKVDRESLLVLLCRNVTQRAIASKHSSASYLGATAAPDAARSAESAPAAAAVENTVPSP